MRKKPVRPRGSHLVRFYARHPLAKVARLKVLPGRDCNTTTPGKDASGGTSSWFRRFFRARRAHHEMGWSRGGERERRLGLILAATLH
ncbi:hypothetical protein JRQ81_015428 [Phrynocephalus forsythii]|uniref:Uncharacterized protein n=1 Tax=Phrynocephalus forsythii TaxID=171643 RepID=A0A9Q1B256_9SAUR|nr:hypothetical protein JRQ81_015428 [Phrynocephalus forsythii]